MKDRTKPIDIHKEAYVIPCGINSSDSEMTIMAKSRPLALNRGKKSIAVIIPARNEEMTVGQVVSGVFREIECEVIVVDDASNDKTIEAAQMAGAHVLPLRFQQGAWGAIRTGLRYARKHGFDLALTLDADGQHQPSSILTLVTPIINDNADIAVGSCTSRGSWARKLTWRFFRKMTMLNIYDLTSGFRAYNRKAIEALVSSAVTLYDYQDIGVLLYLQDLGLVITEVEVEMCSRVAGHSRIFATWGNVFKYLLLTFILCITRTK
jgi:glycosyltransferase involved in cell wall biosynthesis